LLNTVTNQIAVNPLYDDDDDYDDDYDDDDDDDDL
jgi:hypothetical protein